MQALGFSPEVIDSKVEVLSVFLCLNQKVYQREGKKKPYKQEGAGGEIPCTLLFEWCP
jgi:hypothetical protein